MESGGFDENRTREKQWVQMAKKQQVFLACSNKIKQHLLWIMT